MLQWQLVAKQQLRLVELQPTTLTQNCNAKIKVEKILFSLGDYYAYHDANLDNYPIVLGRYAVGVISDVLEGTMLSKMDRVVIEPYITCNNCVACQSNHYKDCNDIAELGITCNGVMTNFIDIPTRLLHKIPDNLTDAKALFVPYVALGLNILDSLQLEKGQHVAVFSSTKLGLILAQLINYYKAVPILISDNPEIIELAKTKLGIFYAFNSTKSNIKREVQIVTGGRMVAEIIYLLNSNYTISNCVDVAANGATICMSGNLQQSSDISTCDIMSKKLKLQGVYHGIGNYPSAINLLVTNQVIVDDMIGQHIDFDRADTELQEISQESITIKSLIVDID